MHTSGCSSGRQSDGELVTGGVVGAPGGLGREGCGLVEDSELVGSEDGGVVGADGSDVGAAVGEDPLDPVDPELEERECDDPEPPGIESGHPESGTSESGTSESGTSESGAWVVAGSVTGGDSASCGLVAGAPPEFVPPEGLPCRADVPVPGGTERACVCCSREFECDGDPEEDVSLSRAAALRVSTRWCSSDPVLLESEFENAVRGGGSTLASLWCGRAPVPSVAEMIATVAQAPAAVAVTIATGFLAAAEPMAARAASTRCRPTESNPRHECRICRSEICGRIHLGGGDSDAQAPDYQSLPTPTRQVNARPNGLVFSGLSAQRPVEKAKYKRL